MSAAALDVVGCEAAQSEAMPKPGKPHGSWLGRQRSFHVRDLPVSRIATGHIGRWLAVAMNHGPAGPLSRPMLRTLVLATMVSLAPTIEAQDHGQPSSALLLLVLDPSGHPVAGAEARLQCDEESVLPALRGITIGDETSLLAKSNERGILRFPFADVPRAGSVLVTTKNELGAFVHRLLPGPGQRVQLQPMAELTTATGTEEFVLWAASTADGRRVTLPPQHGTHVRMPGGSYEVWARSEDGWTWQRLDLASGRRTLLQFQGPAQRLQRAEQAIVHPSGWPEIELLGPGRDECVLLGSAIAAPLVARVPSTGRAVADRVVPGPASNAPVSWPPPDPTLATVRLHLDPPPRGDGPTQVLSLRRTEGNGWRLLGACTTAADGTCSLPRPAAGDDWIVVMAPRHPTTALPWSDVKADGLITLQRGLPLLVTATQANGEPAVDLLLEYVPAGAEVATVEARSDGRGRARLPLLVAPGELRVSDERFQNQGVTLDTIPGDPMPLVVNVGATLRGKVVETDGKALAGVLVTLRDPRNLLRPAARATMTATDGTFVFAGLSETLDLVLFATTQRDDRTWSGRLPHVRAGGEPVEVVLRSEDPELGPPLTGR